MDPTVVAAWIAAGVSCLTLVGTLAAQYFGSRSTSKQLDRTLGEQRIQTLNERFATAAEQLGSDKAAVRLAGVYAMAGLADDWEGNRQTCADVLCAYLRMPYEPAPGESALSAERLAFQANREVRHTVIRVITAHLRKGVAAPWQGLNFDFTGVVFDGGDFTGAQFSSGRIDFSGARFSGGEVDFTGAEFSGAEIYFTDVEFSGGRVYFTDVEFSGGQVWFAGSQFSGWVSSSGVVFSGSEVYFADSRLSGGLVYFGYANFAGGGVYFSTAEFAGGTVDFSTAGFSGGTVDFSEAADWSVPPKFPWTETPPPGVKLPKKDHQSES